MLRLARLRPYAAQRQRFNTTAREWTRNTSTKPSQPQERPWLSRLTPKLSYSLRKRLIPWRYELRVASYIAVFTLAASILFHIEVTYFFTWSATYGISMLPTMSAMGNSIVISKFYRRGKDVGIGDVVSFDHPVDQGVQSVKRVVGLEGDWVCRDTPGVGKGMMIQIPKGHCWVVGDNLSYSRDSRVFGPLPMALIKGKVLASYKPWTDFKWLENGLQPATEDDVD